MIVRPRLSRRRVDVAEDNKAELGVLVKGVAARRGRQDMLGEKILLGQELLQKAADPLAPARPGIGLERRMTILAERVKRIGHRHSPRSQTARNPPST